jgi:23S rRNA pseudouridine1911/1915/1917 synthase
MRGVPPDQEPFAGKGSWTVPADQRPVRLDTFVRRCLPHLSLREARRAIDEQLFRVNDRPGRKGDKLFPGDVVIFAASGHWLASGPLPGRDLHIPILFEDRFILALDKPAGMATHGFSGRETHSLANFLAAIRPSLRGIGKSRWEPGLVHRLDRDTSGIVLAAKDQGSFDDLRAQFRHKRVRKKYQALVHGETEGAGIIEYPLAHDPRDRRKMRAVTSKARYSREVKKWRALTKFQKLACAQGFSLLEVEIETGVTHQIRVHLEAIGHPVVGDLLYGGNRPGLYGLRRHFLHAFHLNVRHPESREALTIESPLPKDLQEILARLGMSI